MNHSSAARPKIPSLGKAVSWRGLVLFGLYIVPPMVYFCLGAWWLFENGLLIYGLAGWLVCTILFSMLSKRWFEGTEKILPPLDWEKPWTFAPRDARAWGIVQETALQANDLTLDRLSRIETYRETTDELARRVAACYYPNVDNPLDKLPIVDLIVAIQLAAEDLERLCRQIPVMDQLTPGHMKGISRAMGVAQSANEIYNFALPVFRPVTGLPRLLVQKLVAEPAWRQTKEGVQRWLFRAYVNRLGVHLVELCSGRLRAGSAAYRRTSGRSHQSEDVPRPENENSTRVEPPFVTRATVLIPGAGEKAGMEQVGLWRHLAADSPIAIAEALNSKFLPLDGIDSLDGILWNLMPWPHDPCQLVPDSEGDSWEDSLGKLIRTDLVIGDFRHHSGEDALAKAQILIDRLGSEYDRLGDWPVAPVVLIAESNELDGIRIPQSLMRETRISRTRLPESPAGNDGDEEKGFDEPEIETIATIVSVLPLVRQRHFARQMASESRKSGLRRAAGQVAEAAGKAGLNVVRGWLKRKSPASTNQPTETSHGQENVEETRTPDGV